MKKLAVIILTFSFILSISGLYAQGDAKDAAKDVLKAYKTKDAALLKKYMSGMMLYVINDEFFDTDDGKPLVEIADKWDGNIKEIRYSKGDMMGKTVLLASVYFSDNPNGNLNVVILSSYENSDWKAFVYGISDASREEFEQGSTEIPSESAIAAPDHSKFSIEMASGDKYEKPTTDKLKELLKSLNDDNFFLILNSEDGFLQASTSEQGYIIQYNDGNGMFEAEEYFTLDKMIEVFVAYIDGKNWKEMGGKWLEM